MRKYECGMPGAALVCLLVVFVVSSSAVAHADLQTATLSGTVADESGGVLPGVTVTATEAGGGSASGVTDGYGRYSLPVAPGTYVVRVELAGFVTFTSDPLALQQGSARSLDVALRIQPIADTVVVTGSRSPEALRAAPVAITVLRAREIERSPAPHFGELLRTVPGVNTIELSARDIQISARTATGRNARTTLALLDGRSVYQDYFGMVLWDLLPVSFDQVKQVEVLRGPGSAIWGANALTGVINIITKSPREMPGTRVRVGLGERGTREAGLVRAGVSGRTGYKVSGSYFTQDHWDRPAATPEGMPLPPYTSGGTTQIKTDLRVDFEKSETVKWRFDAGFASSGGLILVGPGPFDADALRQGYGSVEYGRGSLKATASFTAHDARYEGLLTTATSSIGSQSFVVDVKDTRLVRARHLLVYGGSFKHSQFDISFVPDVSRREEAGAFVTDDIFLNERLHLTAGARVDWFDTFGLSLSPRVGVRFEPRRGHTLRATYNRAYIAPSLVENFTRFPSSIEVPLPSGAFSLPILTIGDAQLEPQTIDAVEAGYTASLRNRATISVSAYTSRTKALVQLLLTETYTAATPPPGWPLPVDVLTSLQLPRTFQFGSVGVVDESGVELSVDAPVGPAVAVSANYSRQARPDLQPREGERAFPINLPPKHRANAAVSVAHGRAFGTLQVSFTDRAFWTDVLAIEGWTERFWMVNGSAGLRLPGTRATWLVRGTNLANRGVQHHIFGDVIRRRVVTELRLEL